MRFITLKRHVSGAVADISSLGINTKRDVESGTPRLDVIGNLPHGAAIHPDTPRDAARLVAWIMESYSGCTGRLVKQERVRIRAERDKFREAE